MTDEMVEVALKMGVRKPKTTEQLMKLTKMEREPLEKLLTEMAWLGIVEYNWTAKTRTTKNAGSCRCLCPAAPSS